jgi:hypothetical protein
VTTIGEEAFSYCTSLTSVSIPDSVTTIGNSAFYNTGYYNTDSNWVNGVLYIDNHLIEAKTDLLGIYSIKEGTKTISPNAFCLLGIMLLRLLFSPHILPIIFSLFSSFVRSS